MHCPLSMRVYSKVLKAKIHATDQLLPWYNNNIGPHPFIMVKIDPDPCLKDDLLSQRQNADETAHHDNKNSSFCPIIVLF